MAVTKGWVECARTYSFPCWRKRGLRHQRTESSNTPLKDFSLISVDFKPVSEGSTCFRCGDQVREDLINSLGIEELLHAEILQTSMDGTDAYDGMLVGSFRGIRRSDYAYSGWGVSAWRRLTRSSIFSVLHGSIEEIEHLSR
jgi:hypothetical protein